MSLTATPQQAGAEAPAQVPDVVPSPAATISPTRGAGRRTRGRGTSGRTPGRARPLHASGWGRALAIASLLGALVPPLYLLSVSLMGRDETVAGVLLPAVPRWENYAAVLGESELPTAVVVSVVCALAAALLSLAAGLGAAWAILRLRVGGPRAVGLLLSPWLLPPVVAVVPLFLMLRGVGLLGTLPGLILVYALINLPVVLWLLLSFVAALPEELLEAARLDGASELQVLGRIGLPLLVPALVAVGLIVGLQNYHEFLLSTFLTQGPESRTAPVALSLFYGDRLPHVGRIAAAGVLTALPPVVAALLLQRRLVSGLTHGASR